MSEGRCHACGCVGPNPGVALSEDEVMEEFEKLLPGFWTLRDDKKELSKEIVFLNFMGAIRFINKAAEVAESPEINHHPDLHLVGFRTVKIVLFTHSVSSLTNVDFMLAKALESVSTTDDHVSETNPTSCQPSSILTSEEISHEFSQLKSGYWQVDDEGKQLSREFVCRNFLAAIDFMNKAAAVAERGDIYHHPDLHLTTYRTIRVVVYTFSVSSLTSIDFKLAKELSDIYVDYSPKWLKEHPECSAV